MFGHSAVIADRLSSWGYVTLAVDSLGPRVSGIANRCDRGLPDQAFDAYAALHYLSQLDFVDPARVAVFGQSMGGETALHAVVDGSLAAQFFKERFRAAVAYYPYCDASMATVAAPSLILVGEADERNPVEVCRETVAHAGPDGARPRARAIRRRPPPLIRLKRCGRRGSAPRYSRAGAHWRER